MIRSWLDALAVYRDRRVLAILALGSSSGLPLLLTFSTPSAWLATEGVSRTAIGLFAAVGTPYSLKFLWSPLIDGIRLPFFGRLGRWLREHVIACNLRRDAADVDRSAGARPHLTPALSASRVGEGVEQSFSALKGGGGLGVPAPPARKETLPMGFA